jgi:hypothetical protein
MPESRVQYPEQIASEGINARKSEKHHKRAVAYATALLKVALRHLFIYFCSGPTY